MFLVDEIIQWYREHAADLRRARDDQRELRARRDLRPRLDDLEAEIAYLTVRALRPAVVVELGASHGWSTTWLLRALRDNGAGELHSFDRGSHAPRVVPAELSAGRWHFAAGDVRAAVVPDAPGFLFVDAAHTVSFAQWYTRTLFPALRPGAAVAVHDVYHGRRPWPRSEGAVVLSWLRGRGVGHLTASRAADPDTRDRLLGLKHKLHLSSPVHDRARDPMLFFRVP
ncbi:class I SAM-dependent methyltransferase [Dactylosporangium sp. AC04546]|uniref:class I SAM-dependent methyltransferase n=1 Tax=Dactylosporangium sp. AC04546 TaxID=2862460 RepID=UPI001EDD9952|nr:class I SAM-dependent methyltransferase [Dactylosporangium sp. AC04546]WVK87550.1 class I SAM-dependent methyltransferase [Dactylosporangium sp. AC04546]